MAAIKRAVAKCQINETLVVSAGGPGIHEKQTGLTDLEGRFKTLVLSRYASVQQAWSAFDVSSKGSLSRSDFKRVVSTTLELKCTDAERKVLRSKLDPQKTKRVSYDALLEFVGGDLDEGTPKKTEQGEVQRKQTVLPMDVPSLPDNFRPRENVEKQLRVKLLDHGTAKSLVSAQGMVI